MIYCFDALIKHHLKLEEDKAVASYYKVIEKILGKHGQVLFDLIHEKKGRWHNQQGGWVQELGHWERNDSTPHQLALAIWEFSEISSQKCFNEFLQAFAD
jgi:hypothetical protein